MQTVVCSQRMLSALHHCCPDHFDVQLGHALATHHSKMGLQGVKAEQADRMAEMLMSAQPPKLDSVKCQCREVQ